MNRTNFQYEDLIFENRNKAYGAYDLRVNYSVNLMRSFFITIGILVLFAFIIYRVTRSDDSVYKSAKMTTPIVMKDRYVIESSFKVRDIQVGKIQKPVTATFPKSIVDPLSFKVTSKVVEPAKAIDPVDPPAVVTPVVGAVPGGVPVDPPISDIGGSGAGLLPSVVSSAVVDKLPEFPGGMEGFYSFLSKHVRFPKEARQEGISGKLFVSFVIDKAGNLVEIEFMKKAGFGMEEAVMAVLEQSPKWKPGLVGSQQVSTKMILPVTFNLVQ